MKILFDFFPILLFFIVIKTHDVYVAITVASIATLIQMGLFWHKRQQFEKTHIISLVLIGVFSGIFIYLQSPENIKLKITLIAWLFAIVLLSSQYVSERNIIEKVLGKAMQAPSNIWKKLNLAWVSFFSLMGLINLYIIYNFDTGTWINFKNFGVVGITVVFVVIQSIMMSKYITHQKTTGDKTE